MFLPRRRSSRGSGRNAMVLFRGCNVRRHSRRNGPGIKRPLTEGMHTHGLATLLLPAWSVRRRSRSSAGSSFRIARADLDAERGSRIVIATVERSLGTELGRPRRPVSGARCRRFSRLYVLDRGPDGAGQRARRLSAEKFCNMITGAGSPCGSFCARKAGLEEIGRFGVRMGT